MKKKILFYSAFKNFLLNANIYNKHSFQSETNLTLYYSIYFNRCSVVNFLFIKKSFMLVNKFLVL